MRIRNLLAGMLALAAGPATAQEQLPSMTLEQALAIARERNPEYQRFIADRNAAESGVRTGYGAFLPDVTANMRWSGSRNTTVTGTDDFGRSVELPQPVTFLSSFVSQDISASMTLFDGLQNVKQLRAARYDVDAADGGLRAAGVRVDAEVMRRFYDALRTELLIAVEEQLLESAQDRLSANERLFRVGSTDQVDVLGAQVDVARQEQALERAHGDAGKARLRVLQQLGVLDESLDFEPVGSLPQPFDPSIFDAESLVARAFDLSPTLSQADAQAAAARQRAGAARGRWLPTVSISGGYRRSLQEQDYSAFGQFNPKDYGFNFGIGISLPIFNGFQTSDAVTQADVASTRAEETYRETRLAVEQGVRSAYIDLQNAYQSLVIQRRATELAVQRMELAREQFRLGSATMTFTQLQTIIEQAANQERALVDAEYQFAVALVGLEEQVGEPVVQ
jgi:outer membrane protein